VNFYDRWVLPPSLDLVMRQSQLEKYRREVFAAASERVLEVGVGSGLNFSLHGKQVETVVGIDLSPGCSRSRADELTRLVSAQNFCRALRQRYLSRTAQSTQW